MAISINQLSWYFKKDMETKFEPDTVIDNRVDIFHMIWVEINESIELPLTKYSFDINKTI